MSESVEGRYSPFNLLYGDGQRTFVTTQTEERFDTVELPAGILILCNRDINDGEVPKIAAIRAQLAGLDLEGPIGAVFEALQKLLRRHSGDDAPLDGVCVHTSGYGTRSSAILSVNREQGQYWYADGAPCETEYEDCSSLLDELRVA